MTDRAFERYKDALRRGHVAALRGELNQAVDAYREAAAIAPDRAIPFTSLGSVLRRLGRAEEALTAYTQGAQRSPSDVIALVGRAELLASMDRWTAAAEAYLALAELHAAESRPAELAAAAGRALELLDHSQRRGSMGRLVGRLRGTEVEPAAAALAERARGLLAGATAPGTGATIGSTGTTPSDATLSSSSGDGAVTGREPIPTTAAGDRSAVPAERQEPLALILAAERSADAGDVAAAVDGYLAAASGVRDDHRWRVALDACSQALVIAPADRRVHLDMAELYLVAGWTTLAADKLRLVARLASLDDDRATTERVCAIVRVWLADDPVLAALCP